MKLGRREGGIYLDMELGLFYFVISRLIPITLFIPVHVRVAFNTLQAHFLHIKNRVTGCLAECGTFVCDNKTELFANNFSYTSYMYLTACVFPKNIQTPKEEIFSLDPLPLISYFPLKILAFESLFPLGIFMNLPGVGYGYFCTAQIWNLIYCNHKPPRCACS